VATMPLRQWVEEASVMAPRIEHRDAAAEGRAERGAGEGLNLYGQVLAWSEDGRYAKPGGGGKSSGRAGGN